MVSTIKFKSLTDQLYEYLSSSIIEGRYEPGEKIVENDLCHQFGISRSPLRECFRILEAEGLVIIHPRKGTFVRSLTSKDIADTFQVRASLESLAAKLAIPNIGDEEIKNFGELITEMEKALGNKDTRSFIRLNFEFHSIYVNASNNQVLKRILRYLGRGLWLRFAFLYYQSPPALALVSQGHKEIVEAFRNRDAVSLQRLIEGHFEDAKKHVLIFFEENNSGPEKGIALPASQ